MIRFESVSKVFSNGYIGLDDVSFEVMPKSLTYVVGESGAGKTTLMRLLIREFDPTGGEIYFGDEPISQMPAKQLPYLRRRIGVVFQDYKLLPDKTVYENITFIHEIAGVQNRDIRAQVQKVLELVGLEDRQDLFPVQLSGGESQRISIARALALTPDVLFADEPTGNLDPKTGAEIGELLQHIAELGTTVLVSTHDQQLLKRFAAPEIHLHQGRLVKNTTPGAKVTSRKDDSDDNESEEETADRDDSTETESHSKKSKNKKSTADRDRKEADQDEEGSE